MRPISISSPAVCCCVFERGTEPSRVSAANRTSSGFFAHRWGDVDRCGEVPDCDEHDDGLRVADAEESLDFFIHHAPLAPVQAARTQTQRMQGVNERHRKHPAIYPPLVPIATASSMNHTSTSRLVSNCLTLNRDAKNGRMSIFAARVPEIESLGRRSTCIPGDHMHKAGCSSSSAHTADSNQAVAAPGFAKWFSHRFAIATIGYPTAPGRHQTG